MSGSSLKHRQSSIMPNSKTTKIVVACDSFKGSLTSLEAGQAVAHGVSVADSQAKVRVVAVADGGEGTVDAVIATTGGSIVRCAVQGPSGNPTSARYAIVDDGRCAVMELAEASGLGLVPADRLDPLSTSSFGTGQMIADALDRGCRRIVIGIGGSATVDGGTGLLEALGARFSDVNGKRVLPCGATLSDIADIDLSALDKRLVATEITVACDVDNVLCGPQGAAFVFGPQKGATPQQCALLDNGLAHFAVLAERITGTNLGAIKGGGAAGGVGAALAAFLKADLVPGSHALLDAIGFDAIIADADLIITGEGHIDRQTLGGKLPFGVLQRGIGAGIPVIAVAGRVSDAELLTDSGFAAVIPIVDNDFDPAKDMNPSTAKANIVRAVVDFINANKRR